MDIKDGRGMMKKEIKYRMMYRALECFDKDSRMNKINDWIQESKMFGIFGLGVKVINDGRMSSDEECVHMYTPCPICGKINRCNYFESSAFIPGRKIYTYTCSDSSHLLKFTAKEAKTHNQSGCGARYRIKINKNKELVKSNLQLNKKEMSILTNSIPNKDVEDIKIVQEKQRKYWMKRYAELGIKK